MTDLVHIIFTFLTTLAAASSGFWIYLKSRSMAKDATTKLMMGLAHDKITYLGLKYIDRGYITKDEYTDLIGYFYNPYRELGGNGTAELIIHAIQKLPLSSRGPVERATDTVQISVDDSGMTDNIKGTHDEKH